MRRDLALTAMTALLATVGIHVAAGTSAVSKEGVSAASVAPRPFHTNDARMRVTFTTTGRARPGFQYLVLYTIGPNSFSEKCASFGASDERNDVVRKQTILGAAGRSYTVIFKPVRISPLFPVVNGFCPGRAFVEFTSVSITHPSKKTSRQLGPTVKFRVLRAG